MVSGKLWKIWVMPYPVRFPECTSFLILRCTVLLVTSSTQIFFPEWQLKVKFFDFYCLRLLLP